MRPPSVLFVSPYEDRRTAGSSESRRSALTWYTAELTQALRCAGCDVGVVGPIVSDAEPWLDAGVRIVPSYERGHVSAARQIRKAVRGLPSDVVHVQHEVFAYGGLVTAFGLPHAMHGFGRPIVTTIHGVIPLDRIDRQFVRTNAIVAPPWVVRALWRRLIRSVAANSSVIVVHEVEHQTWLREQYGVRTRIEVQAIGTRPDPPLDLLTARKRLDIDHDSRVVLFFGNLLERKGIVPFLASVDALLANDAELVVVVAGIVPERVAGATHTMQTIERLRSRARFRYLGFVANDDVATIFAAADVVILPYTFSMSASGPFALAIGARRPVLLSDVFGAAYAEAPLRFEPTTPGIVDAVRTYFSDSNSRERALAFVTALAERRTWAGSAKKMTEIYASVCSPNIG